MKTAIYPGSFDPITLGHLNIVRRASHIFDNVIICVMINTEKTPLFSPEERVEMIKKVTKKLKNVSVEMSDTLVAEYATKRGDCVIIKGLRAVSDFEKEFQMAMINKRLNHKLDTLFLASSEKYTYLSSTMVKEMGRYGSDLNDFVPREIIEDVKAKISQRR